VSSFGFSAEIDRPTLDGRNLRGWVRGQLGKKWQDCETLVRDGEKRLNDEGRCGGWVRPGTKAVCLPEEASITDVGEVGKRGICRDRKHGKEK
jgi:hypothetical protein